MNKLYPVLLIFFSILSCSTGDKKETLDFRNYEFHPPIYFYNLLDKSSVGYSVGKREGVFTDLSHTRQKNSISPYAYTDQRNDGSGTLIIKEPEGKLLTLYHKAEQLEAERKYPELIEVYRQALELDETYFKNWTNLGYSYYLNNDYVTALTHFKKAIDLNSVGYQEHLYLAAAYYELNDFEKALKAITRAYMLNRNDEEVMSYLLKILEENRLYLNSERMQFPFEVEKVNRKKCNIFLDPDEGVRWIGMAYCFAAWEMEQNFISMNKKIIKQNIINVVKYKEAFYNQTLIIASMLDKNEEVSNKERRLYDAVDYGFIDAIILWEIVVPRIPELILVLPDETRETIVNYITGYVYNDGSMDFGI